MNKLEQICNENKCKTCPLLIKRFVEDDPVYDYHETVICYLKEYNKIKKIEKFIQNTLKEEMEEKIKEFKQKGLTEQEAIDVVKKLLNENEEKL